jgi:hypothetical protein
MGLALANIVENRPALRRWDRRVLALQRPLLRIANSTS